MAENYEVGKTYYMPVRVYGVMDSTYTYPVRIEFEIGNGCMDGKGAVKSDPGLLFTAYEVYLCNVTALKEEITTLKSENARLSKQNEELGTKADDLEAELQNAKAAIDRWREIENHNTSYIDKQTQAINRKDKEIEILIDRITKLEAELAEEREKNNG